MAKSRASRQSVKASRPLSFVSGRYDEVLVGSNYYTRRIGENGYSDLLVREAGNHLLIRSADRPSDDEALFLNKTEYPKSELENLKPSTLPAWIQAGKIGRCLLYHDPIMTQYQKLFLGFRADGTGTAFEYWDETPFYWETGILPSGKNLFTVDVALLRTVCPPLFRGWINSHMPDPYIFQTEFNDIARFWEYGSEWELRRLTQAICHTEPGLFARSDLAVVTYQAALPQMRGGLTWVQCNETPVTNRRLMALCDLAFRLNRFQGATWSFRALDPRVRCSAPNRRSGCHLVRDRLVIRVAPPTPEEVQEAIFTLAVWLDDKLHDREKRAWLIPPWEKYADL